MRSSCINHYTGHALFRFIIFLYTEMKRCDYACFRGSQGLISAPGQDFFFNVRDDNIEEDIPNLQIPGPTFRINRGDTLNFRGDNISVTKTPDGVLIDLVGPTGTEPNFSGYYSPTGSNDPLFATGPTGLFGPAYVQFPYSTTQYEAYIDSINFNGTFYTVSRRGIYNVFGQISFILNIPIPVGGSYALTLFLERNGGAVPGTALTSIFTNNANFDTTKRTYIVDNLLLLEVGDRLAIAGQVAVTSFNSFSFDIDGPSNFNVALIKRVRQI